MHTAKSIHDITEASIKDRLTRSFPDLSEKITSEVSTASKKVLELMKPVAAARNEYGRAKIIQNSGFYVKPVGQFINFIEKPTFNQDLPPKKLKFFNYFIPLRENLTVKIKGINPDLIIQPPIFQPEIISTLLIFDSKLII